ARPGQHRAGRFFAASAVGIPSRTFVDMFAFFGENVVTATTSRKRTLAKGRMRRMPVASSSVGLRGRPLSTLTDECLNHYFSNLNGHKPGDLYQLVIGEVEKPLFKAVLSYTAG